MLPARHDDDDDDTIPMGISPKLNVMDHFPYDRVELKLKISTIYTP